MKEAKIVVYVYINGFCVVYIYSILIMLKSTDYIIKGRHIADHILVLKINSLYMCCITVK